MLAIIDKNMQGVLGNDYEHTNVLVGEKKEARQVEKDDVLIKRKTKQVPM